MSKIDQGRMRPGELPKQACMVCRHFRFKDRTSPVALCKIHSSDPPMPAKHFPKVLVHEWDKTFPEWCRIGGPKPA